MDASCGIAVGDAVDLVLDRERRDDHAEQHSAQHLLSAIAYARYGAVTKSFHLGQDRSTIDLDIHPFTPEMVRDCEEAANRMVGERRPVRVHRCPPGDIQSLDLRLRKPPPEGEAVLRIVEIEEVDASPCCGTHVRSTLELRLLRIVSAEKYKGMTRIAFVAGNRAVRESTLRSLALDQAARSLGVAWQEVGDRIAAMSARIASLRENLDALGAWKTRRLAQAAVEAWRKDGSPAILAGEDAATDVDAAMDFVRTCFRAEVPAVAVVPGALTVCVALPASVRVDPGIRVPAAVGQELSILAKSLGARGGGPPTGFRATFGSPVAMDAFILELRRRLAPESRTAVDPPATP